MSAQTSVIDIAVDGPLWIWHWIVFDVLQDSIQQISLSVCMFCSLVAYVIVCCYWCQPDMLSVVCDSPTSCCNLYGAWSVMVIVVSLPNNHPMGPWSTVFSLNCYRWPYGNRCKNWWSIIVCVILCCLCTNLLWCLSSLSPPIGFLSKTGITPHTGWLNSSVAGLDKPCPIGVVWIL